MSFEIALSRSGFAGFGAGAAEPDGPACAADCSLPAAPSPDATGADGCGGGRCATAAYSSRNCTNEKGKRQRLVSLRIRMQQRHMHDRVRSKRAFTDSFLLALRVRKGLGVTDSSARAAKILFSGNQMM